VRAVASEVCPHFLLSHAFFLRPCCFLPAFFPTLQIEMVQHIKREHPGLDVICGNVVATWQVGCLCILCATSLL
jgi:hypothetical protein